MLNKTRVDNLPPLQELSVFEQSFESRRKQPNNQVLRSRSKNYRNLESGSFVNSAKDQNMMIEDNIPSTGTKDNLQVNQVANKKEIKTRKSNLDGVIENSISIVSGLGSSGKDILIKTASKTTTKDFRRAMSKEKSSAKEKKSYSKNTNSSISNHSRFTIKNKKNTK